MTPELMKGFLHYVFYTRNFLSTEQDRERVQMREELMDEGGRWGRERQG